MKIAFQMDPITSVDINADSSFRLAEEAQSRGHTLFYYSPDELSYREGRVMARGHQMQVQRVAGQPAELDPMQDFD
ncbi:MAG: glutathione synthase, partial [Pseudomonadota bacterium]